MQLRLLIGLAIGLSGLSAEAALSPPPHPLFDGDAVHEIHLTFHQPDWWDSLRANFEGQDDPVYLWAEFEWGDLHFDSIGVRFKGNSSYSYPGVKKSFKLDIDEYVAGQTIFGLDKLNLNNEFHDPTMVREKCCFELCEAMGLPTVRTNYCALYLNGDYWGLYLLVEQFDQEFIDSRFGPGEAGNLWKGDPRPTLEYRGSAEPLYYNQYELENNETENDWSALVEFIDRLNNTSLADLPDSLHNTVDVNTALAMLAIDNFTVNLDSYVGRCANFYMYHRELDGRFVFSKWDCNEAWGLFNMWQLSPAQMQQLDPYWVNPQPNEHRPLAERLYQIPAYQEIYLGHLRKLMAGAANADTLIARMEELRDLIRPSVHDDPNFMFTAQQFELSLTQNVQQGPRVIPALAPFIIARDSYLRSQIGSWEPMAGLVLNELMASNGSTAADEFGDYDDWIEIANIGDEPVNLEGLGLVDHFDGSEPYFFPDTTIAAGGYLVVWADEEPEQGAFHAPFRLDGDGEDVYLIDGGVIVDQVSYRDLSTDVSYGRWPDGTGEWTALSVATPGAANDNSFTPEEIVLCVNEFLALNESVHPDEAGAYEDWVEIYNPGPQAVQMGGLFLTDDLSNPTKWSFPDTVLDIGEYLLVWCDEDAEDGPLHASFRLSGDGEEIGLFGRLAAGNEEIDSYQFGTQATDISEGRTSDCADNWSFFSVPTPGSPNMPAAAEEPGTAEIPSEFALYQNYPNPFNSETTIAFDLPRSGPVSLTIYNAIGRRIVQPLHGEMEAGRHRIGFSGHGLASGLYFYRLEGEGFTGTRKMLLIK